MDGSYDVLSFMALRQKSIFFFPGPVMLPAATQNTASEANTFNPRGELY